AACEAEAMCHAHAAFFLRLASEAAQAWMCDDDVTTREEPEHDNLRAALEWTIAQGSLDDAISLLLGLANLWLARGLLREAHVWFDQILGHPVFDASPLHYRALWARGMLALIDGIPHPALLMGDAISAQAMAAEDGLYVARSAAMQGIIKMMADPAAGEELLLEGRRLADETGDLHSAQFSRMGLLAAAIHREDHERAARYYAEAQPVLAGAAGMQAMFDAQIAFSEVRAGRFDAARLHSDAARRLAAEVGDPTLAGAMADLSLALVELAEGSTDAAGEVLEAALREPRASGPTREDPMLTAAWGQVLAARGDLAGAEAAMTESVRLAVQVGDGVQHGLCLGWLAALLRLLGDQPRARTAAEDLLAHGRQQSNPGQEAIALRELAQLARLEGDLVTADDFAHRALGLCAAAGILPDLQQTLVAVAGIAAAEESWEEAARLFGAADGLGTQLGSVLPVWDRPAADADLDLVRQALGPEAFDRAYGEGGALPVDDAVAYAERGRGERKRPSSGWAGLTPMERQVVDLVAEGLRNTEIAARLFVAPSTIKTHLAHAFAKLGVSTRAELAVLAARRQRPSVL
ncbi:MAG: LuxR C-terminal-related transcriptional regulator, partial [Actinobacteria bacterium]|nr:LuxR C-terminal-related transcriptional regulator [Actinomycetota bacterium]